MTTQYTPLLGLALPVTGELSGTWGDVTNDSITSLIDDSVAGYATHDVTSGDWTLTTTGSGAPNQARMAILIPTGTPGVSRNIIAPQKSKIYLVVNTSDETVVLKGAATTGVEIPSYTNAICAWDGSDFQIISNVTGPTSATDTGIAVYDGGTGKYLKNSNVLVDASDNVTVPGNLTLQAQSDLRFADADSSNWVAFQAPPSVVNNVTWVLPGTDGASNQVLSTNGSGTLSWESTQTLPDQAGNAGKYLYTNGVAASWETGGGGGGGITAGQSITYAMIFGF